MLVAVQVSPRTWYGMPRVCQRRQGRLLLPKRAEFQTTCATLGFSDKANLDEGAMWPTSFALKELTAAEETKIGALVKKAAR